MATDEWGGVRLVFGYLMAFALATLVLALTVPLLCICVLCVWCAYRLLTS